ncbi:T9SS type A sorting domain-containing protein [Aquimarina sp. AU119]|uniref:T9SS type A sorting domain-containing protein n=1 Tax=Aquimarina sp. AU119 TaxID=2108528 RepID=UPI000D68D567|nr:T9SS type A sorting domain-containing protein [Aquimarina sp. AU119]
MKTNSKNLLTFLFLLFSCILFAQQTSIQITNYNYTADFDDGRCDDEIRMTAYFRGGGSERFIRYRNRPDGPRADRELIVNGDVTHIDVYIYGKDQVSGGIFGDFCAGGSFGGRARGTYRINLPNYPCNQGSFDERQSDSNVFNGSNEVRQRLRFNYEVTPLPRVQRTSPSDIVGYEDAFQVQGDEGFRNDAYNWQYSFLNGSTPLVWQEVPGASFDPLLNIRLEDIFDESAIGRDILFRIAACDYDGPEGYEVVSYRIRKSAPKIIDVSTTPVSCFDATDGEITITFDRPLIGGDLFGFSISDRSDPDGDVVANANNITTLDVGNTLTIRNLPPSNTDFLIEAIGTYDGEPYYTGEANHSAVFTIGRPAPVSFVEEPRDNAVNVYCFGGQDGTIEINAAGGDGNYEYLMRKENETWDENEWMPFSSGNTHTIRDLFPDTYYLKIRDGNECVAKEQTLVDGEIALGEEIIERVNITQPDAPLFITTEILNPPQAYGFEDGRILATITGGTLIDGDSYEFEWRDENDNIINTTSAIYNAGQGYLVTLHSVGGGQYTITARDANYSGATNKEGCTMVSESITLIQPLPIEISIEVFPISCNAGNTYSDNIDTNFDGVADQFQDGVLVATVTGGVPFDIENPDYSVPVPANSNGDLVPYFYDWKIQQGDGSWIEIPINNNRIDFLDTATNYSLNVTDKNGIVLGSYIAIIEADGSRSYSLVQAEDVVEYLPQPEVLALDFTKTDVTCANGDDGALTVTVTGGVEPYTYEWSNGNTTMAISDLIAGTYLVFITDAKGCQIEGNVVVEQSNNIEIEPISVVSPTCFEGSDGQIGISVNGGVLPYTYLWNTGSVSSDIRGIPAGTYRVEITDASGCKAFYEETLINPDPIVVNIEEKRSLCGEQSLALDITIDDPEAIYSWTSTNGFASSESSVTLTETGTYVAMITTGQGCVGIGEVIVESFDRPIDSNFYITTQAYSNEDVILINVSNPIGEVVEWNIPEGVEVVSKSDEELIVRFEKEGTYDINLVSYQGDCYESFEKTILVQPAIEAPQLDNIPRNFIEEFILYPNPSKGIFKTKISLKEASNITLKIIDLVSGATINKREEKDSQELLLEYSLSISSGVYLMLLETPNGSETRKLIVE